MPNKVYFLGSNNFHEDENILYLDTGCSNHVWEGAIFFFRRNGKIYRQIWKQCKHSYFGKRPNHDHVGGWFN